MGNLHSVTSNKVVVVYFPLNLIFLEGGGVYCFYGAKIYYINQKSQ